MNDCVFCKIVKKEIPAHLVYEDDNALAFLDTKPVAPGHVLLIPKQHYAAMPDTPDDVLSGLFVTAKRLMAIIKLATGADFVLLSVVGVDIPHFHIHLIPRYASDGLAHFLPTKQIPESQMRDVAEKIRGLVNSQP